MDSQPHSATQIVGALRRGDGTAVAWVEQLLQRISRAGSLNAFVDVPLETGANPGSQARTGQRALEAAATIDGKRRRGDPVGRLAGLPLAVKDGICVAGTHTTAGSKMLQHFVAPYDATSVARWLADDGIVIGKTNLDEFSMGSSTEHSVFGPTRNPYRADRVAGGSSGGSAAAVAAGLVPVALGSDTGGSIRQPASFCGITGLKPTYGHVSRYGLIAFASSLDQIGPLARTAEDCALVMATIAGHDPRDSTSMQGPEVNWLEALKTPLAGLRIGVCPEFFGSGLDPEIEVAVRQALVEFQQLGAMVVDVTLPNAAHAVATYYVIASCEASSNLSRYDGVRYTCRAPADDLDQMYSRTRGTGFGPEVQRRIMLGTYALSSGYYDAYYLQASRVRRLIKHDFDQAFRDVDVIVGPTTPTTAFAIGQHAADPLSMYLADIYNVSANLAGIPAVSIPCGISRDGLPIGLQIQACRFADSKLLNVAHQFQLATDWHRMSPDPDPEEPSC